MGTITTISSLIMIACFTVAIIGFATNFAIDNDSPIDIADDAELSLLSENSEGNLSDFRGDTFDTYQSIVQSSIDTGDTTQTGGQFAITPTSALGAVKNILKVGYVKIFGTGSGFGIFLTTLFGFFGFVLGMYVWKSWKSGAVD